jgi:predicted nucleic acid-binding protein
MIVADTDVLIDFLAGRNAGERVGAELERGALATTAVTRFELLSGARDAAQEKLLRQLLDTLLTLALDQEAADRAAAVRRSLEHMGRPIGMGDSLIAGIVLSRHAILLTRNRRHFKAVPDLQLA